MLEEEYRFMEKGQKAARIGLDSEKDIINMINTNESFQVLFKKCLNTLGFNPEDRIKARRDHVKADILIRINNHEELGVSIKSTKETSFHHIDRRYLDKWKAFLTMPDAIFGIMKEAIMRIARNSRDKFIMNTDRDKIRDFFLENLKSVIYEIFRKGEEDLKLFLINDKRGEKRKIYLFNMDDVLDFLLKNANNISFSNKGIIYLGDFISIQRKSGDGKHIKIPKTDWKHPGNQVQFKFSPVKFAEHIENTEAIKFCTIYY